MLCLSIQKNDPFPWPHTSFSSLNIIIKISSQDYEDNNRFISFLYYKNLIKTFSTAQCFFCWLGTIGGVPYRDEMIKKNNTHKNIINI